MNGQFARAYLGIGEVLVELRAEFPDISVSKIRFLEAEGLISPARSPSGYRRFGPSDVDQLRFILTAQRDQYLPLRVIRERLAGGAAPGTGEPADGDRPAQPPNRTQSEAVSQRELLDSAGISAEQLAELEAHGLIRRVGRLYGQDTLDVAATVAALASYGVQARHLRSARTAADRDISLIEQVVAPTLRQRSPHARQAAGQTAREIAALLLRLHSALIEAALAEAGLPGEELMQDSQAAQQHAEPRDETDRGRPGVTGASA
jgi:DNA-binding transcriptional MerR regulator